MGLTALLFFPKEVVQRTFIILKNPSHRPGSNPQNVGSMANKLTITPSTRLN
jgi:hypothetical protein